MKPHAQEESIININLCQVVGTRKSPHKGAEVRQRRCRIIEAQFQCGLDDLGKLGVFHVGNRWN